VNLSEYNRTLDFLELKDIYSDKNYIINFTRNMLYLPLKNQFDNKFIIQVNIGEFCGEEELQNCQKLHELGFSLVLNCSNIDNLPAELLKVAAYVKLVPHKISVDAIKRLVYKNKDIVFIGSQIDSSQQHVLAQKAGCSLFQGHYFKNARPFVEKVVALEPLRANYFRLLRLTCTSGHVDFYEISKIISSDPAMSYRLLKLINSVGMGIKQAITTIPMALTYLGEENLKKWIAVVCLRGITPDKPLELIRTSLIRAKFGENLAPHLNTQGNHEDIFMMGLLSLLHVALNMHQEDLLEEITVSPDIRESYLSQTGKYSGLLAFFKDYEHSNWEGVTQFAKKNNISNNTINEAYIAAAKWYGELLKYDNADAMPPNQG